MGSESSDSGLRTCAACGTGNSGNSRFCRGCGAVLPASSVCSTCGAAVAMGAKFCPGCGAPRDTVPSAPGPGPTTAPSVAACGACGTAYSPPATFCRQCGAPLLAAVVPPPGIAAPVAYPMRRGSRWPLYAGAVVVVALLVVLFLTGVIPGLSHDKKNQPSAVSQATVPPKAATAAPTNVAPAKATATPTPNPVWAKITPEDLLAAIFTRAELEQLINKAGDQWWPIEPHFGGPPLPDLDYPGERFYAAQQFDRVSGPGWFEVDLSMFPDAATASSTFASLLSTVDNEVTIVAGPAVADEQRYFTQTNTGDDAPNESDVRFRVGPVIARISWADKTAFQTPATMARYATSLVMKLNSLLAGHVTAPGMRPELAALLPPTVQGVGPVLGTAALAPEAWSYGRDASGQLSMPAVYSQGVLSQLAFRRYSLAADPTQVVEVTLFPFRDTASAQAFMTNEIRLEPDILQRKLDPGKTGQLTGYFLSTDGIYWLEFAVGSYAADVQCFSPYEDVTSACEAAVRQVGEAWYTRLSTVAPLTR